MQPLASPWIGACGLVGIDIAAAVATDQYLTFDTQDTISKFMVSNWADHVLFHELVSIILQRGKSGGRRARSAEW